VSSPRCVGLVFLEALSTISVVEFASFLACSALFAGKLSSTSKIAHPRGGVSLTWGHERYPGRRWAGRQPGPAVVCARPLVVPSVFVDGSPGAGLAGCGAGCPGPVRRLGGPVDRDVEARRGRGDGPGSAPGADSGGESRPDAGFHLAAGSAAPARFGPVAGDGAAARVREPRRRSSSRDHSTSQAVPAGRPRQGMMGR
jgi:hypothetical protein